MYTIRRKSLKSRALRAVSGTVLMLAGAGTSALAQVQQQSEEVVVSATRIVRDGYSAPTPTTVIGAQDIQNAGEANVFDVINQLPSLAGSASTATGNGGSSGGTNGLSTFNLRNLGTNRTLVLLDGERVVGATTTGVTDISEFPQGLIQRVDVVTGGASASWGSDAVAGVINFVLDKKFDGVKANVSGSETTYGDDQGGQFELTAGTGFDGGRGHIEVSGEFATEAGVGGANTRPWYNRSKVLQLTIAGTPAGSPEYTAAANVVDYQVAPGGVITGAGTSLNKSIVNTTFGPNGSPSMLQLGSPLISPFMIGGDQNIDFAGGVSLAGSLTRGTFYSRVSYDIAPNFTIYATVNYGEVHTRNTGGPAQKTASLTIQCDNAYLPAAVATACGGAGHSFQFGTTNADIGPLLVDNERTTRRYVVGGDGAFNVLGTAWTWSAYFEHGENDITNVNPNETLTPYYNAAIDAVTNPSGTIVCRSAVAQADGCVPLDIFGTGVASQAAKNWVTGKSIVPVGPYLLTALRQEAGGATFNAEPFSDWAGPISIATGFEYREEAFSQSADCASQGNCGDPLLTPAPGSNWFSGNFHASHGSYHVVEGLLETVVPLLKDSVWGVADLDAAARATGYSTAGYVTTWKAGLTFSPGFMDGIKFRVLQSRDVRAPNLSELYTAPQVFIQTVVNDFGPSAGQTFTIQRPQIGNAALQPEKSQTTEIGLIFQPSWLPAFSTSVDYYRIGVKNAIGTLTNQQEMDLCFQGNQNLCKLITFNAAQQPTSLTVESINLSSVVTDGVDIESTYRSNFSDIVPDLPGQVTVRSLVSHVSKFITSPGIPNAPLLETAGQNSGAIATWRWLGTESYDGDKFSFSLTERWISPGVNNRAWIQCTTGCPLPTINNPTINDNHVAGAFYLDVGGSYNLTNQANDLQAQLYFKIDNVANVSPPVVPSSGSLAYLGNGTNPLLYDTLGRMYRIGFRIND